VSTAKLGKSGLGLETVGFLSIPRSEPSRFIRPALCVSGQIDGTTVAHAHKTPAMSVVCIEAIQPPLLVKDELIE
jgi:hypothetical protein